MKQPLDHLRSRKQPVTRNVWIAGDDTLAEEYEGVKARIKAAESFLEIMKTAGRPAEEILAKQTEIDELVATEARLLPKVKENSILFVFKTLPPPEFDRLLEAHPPTDEQRAMAKEAGEDIGFNPKTYPMELIIACCVQPELEKDELREWLNDGSFNYAEVNSMFQAALMANQSRRVLDLGKG